MTQEAGTGTAIYYPCLGIDSECLKCMLLYWDRIRRIIPEEARDEINDDLSVQHALAEGLLIDTSPARYREAASKTFLEKIEPLLTNPTKEVLDCLKKARSASRGRRQSARKKIHRGKGGKVLKRAFRAAVRSTDAQISPALSRLIDQGDLGRVRGQWIDMPSVVADHFMACLCQQISQEIKAPLATDNPTIAPISEYLQFCEPAGDDLSVPKSAMLRMTIKFPRPSAFKSVSMDEITAFRNKHKAERRAFRSLVQDVSLKLSKCSDPSEVEDTLAEHRHDMQQHMSDHQKRLKALHLKQGAMGLLTLSVPSGLTDIASAVGPAFIDPGALGVAGIALAATAWWASYRVDGQKVAKSNRWHYGLRTSTKFS